MHKKAIVTILLFSLATTASAQPDSLEKLLNVSSDTQRVNRMNTIAGMYLSRYRENEADTALFNLSIRLSRKALDAGTSINYEKGIGESLYNWGLALSYIEGHKQSLGLLSRALPILRKTNGKPDFISYCMNALAEDFHAIGQYKEAILYYDSSKNLLLQIKDSNSAAYSAIMKGHCYYDLGDYKDAYTYEQEASEMAIKIGNTGLQVFCMANLANLFLGADLPKTSIDYMHQIMQLFPDAKKNVRGGLAWGLSRGGEAFLKLKQVDSAAAIAQMLFIDTTDVESTLFAGRLAVAQHDYQRGLYFFQTGYHFSQVHDHPIAVARHANEMASVYLLLKNYKLAVFYANEAVRNAQQIHALQELKNAYGHLGDIYGETKDYAKAFDFGKQYKLLSDSLAPDEYRRILALIQVQHELNNQKQAVQILSKENLLKESNLRQEKTIRNTVISALLAILAIGILVIRNIQLKRKKDHFLRLMEETNIQLENREKEQKLAELEREKTDLEMQALRARMNPHFIFNCLSSINRFILKNETEAASGYLTKFSRLIRMVLVNSKNTMILLDDELDMLRLYLDMERLRFRDAFDYSINLTNDIDLRGLFIPPLLLQPFTENAIWHGLMHKEGNGKLTIELSLKNDILYCVITDNGIGREKAADMKSHLSDKQKSLGLQITADRLALINKGINDSIYFDIEDLLDEAGNAAGTRVTVKINCGNHTNTYTN